MRSKEGVPPGGSGVRTPLLLPETPADGVAVEAEKPRELPDADSLSMMPPADLLPHIPSDHSLLLGPTGLKGYNPFFLCQFKSHMPPSLGRRVGENSVPIVGDFCIPADTANAAKEEKG